jgi:hypothetical protein
MRKFLDNAPPELNLNNGLIFTSKENNDICEKLIPKLQKEVKPAYDLSQKQVKNWLKTFHQNKRRKHKQ